MIQGKKEQVFRTLNIEARTAIEKFLVTINEKSTVGEIPLIGEDVFAKILRYDTSLDNNNMVEAHNEYVDIQLLISGTEVINVYDREKLRTKKEYSAESDCEFFDPSDEALLSRLLLKPDYFVVLFPNDAHLAALNPDKQSVSIHKVVIKVNEKYFA